MYSNNIIKYPDKRLLVKSKKVETINNDIHCIIKDMFNIMYMNKGIGLAAIQIGVNLKIIVIDVNLNNKTPIAMINPKIINFSGTQLSNEACLSFPGIFVQILRHKYVKIEYINEFRRLCYIEAEDIFSRCIQHEIDHLNGLTIFDHLSKLKIKRITGKLCA